MISFIVSDSSLSITCFFDSMLARFRRTIIVWYACRGFYRDSTTINVYHDHDVFVARQWTLQEFSCLVGVDCLVYGVDLCGDDTLFLAHSTGWCQLPLIALAWAFYISWYCVIDWDIFLGFMWSLGNIFWRHILSAWASPCNSLPQLQWAMMTLLKSRTQRASTWWSAQLMVDHTHYWLAGRTIWPSLTAWVVAKCLFAKPRGFGTCLACYVSQSWWACHYTWSWPCLPCGLSLSLLQRWKLFLHQMCAYTYEWVRKVIKCVGFCIFLWW